MPVFRGRLTRKEPPYPTINSALDELDDPRRRGLDLPPRVVTVRHHPYGHRVGSYTGIYAITSLLNIH